MSHVIPPIATEGYMMSGPEEGDTIDAAVFVLNDDGDEVIGIASVVGDIEEQKELGRRVAAGLNSESLLKAYLVLHDGLSDMIESGRLTEGDIPDDYTWLVESLGALGSHTGNKPVDETKETTKTIPEIDEGVFYTLGGGTHPPKTFHEATIPIDQQKVTERAQKILDPMQSEPVQTERPVIIFSGSVTLTASDTTGKVIHTLVTDGDGMVDEILYDFIDLSRRYKGKHDIEHITVDIEL